MTKAWLKLLGICLIGAGTASAWAANQSQIDTARTKGLWWILTHQHGEGRWGSSPVNIVASTATTLEALNQAGVRGPIFSRGYSWLANAPAASVDSLARQIAALSASGGNTSRLISDLVKARNSLMAWGSYAGYDTSYPDTALALNALLPVASYARADVINAICLMQTARRAEGGWSFARSEGPVVASSGILPTTQNLLVLDAAKTIHALPNSFACPGYFDSDLNNMQTTGKSWLLTQRNLADNGFGAGGVSSVIETAFAYQALNKLAPNDEATAPALDYLLSKQNPDGSWGGDAFQTALVMKLLPPPLSPLKDTDKDGIPDDVEVLMGTNPNIADTRGIAVGNGDQVPGLTIPTVLAAEAILGQVFSVQLTAEGGTTPYNWAITTGSLPPGISLSPSGLISGTPTALGSYAFYYTVTDSAVPVKNTLVNVVAQIDVYQSKPSLADGDINGDLVVDAADVALAERFALGLATPTPTQLQRADVSPAGNPNGVIDAADVARIRLKALGLDN